MLAFLGKPKGSGTYKLASGKSLELRYRVEFFKGIATPKLIEQKFESFATDPLHELTVKRR